MQYGIDDEYADKGVKSQGVLMANYVFWESFDQAHSGIFQGILYSKWYLNSDSNIKYDDILQFADGYSNNAFIGTWKSYSTGIEKICNWADFRVPMANSDFDIGVGDFAPSEKYWDKGWETYLRAWSLGDKKAESEEFKIWWQ